MQDGLITLPQWAQTTIQVLASAFAGGWIVRAYNVWLNRRKPAAEINVAEASATEIHVRAGSSASDAVIRMMVHLERAQETIDRLRVERDAWQDEYDKVFTERDELLRKNSLLESEVKNYENQVETMRGTLKVSKVNYDNSQDTKITEPLKK